MKTPGSILLLAGSIVLIIFVALFLLIPVMEHTAIVLDGIIIASVIFLLGVLGIIWCNNPKKSMFYIATGMVFFIFWLISFILDTLMHGEVSISDMLMFVNAALYIIGGTRKRQYYFSTLKEDGKK